VIYGIMPISMQWDTSSQKILMFGRIVNLLTSQKVTKRDIYSSSCQTLLKGAYGVGPQIEIKRFMISLASILAGHFISLTVQNIW